MWQQDLFLFLFTLYTIPIPSNSYENGQAVPPLCVYPFNAKLCFGF